MSSQSSVFGLYHSARPPKITVWCTQGFKAETGDLYRSCNAADRMHFFNVNQLIERFACGEQLSKASFPRESMGYAFKSGTLRFYGVFSTRHSASFVLSHAIIKRHAKLQASDIQRMKNCLAAFDCLMAPPTPQT